ncbi:hypothetical protein D1839_18710 [Roseburia sp. 1XD42-34]|nr:hypothetical protein [Roseburia sp. 1XD42-34]RKI74548.1 hypothetical protein D7V87_18500 [Clostridium sp. 1xD42-85]
MKFHLLDKKPIAFFKIDDKKVLLKGYFIIDNGREISDKSYRGIKNRLFNLIASYFVYGNKRKVTYHPPKKMCMVLMQKRMLVKIRQSLLLDMTIVRNFPV